MSVELAVSAIAKAKTVLRFISYLKGTSLASSLLIFYLALHSTLFHSFFLSLYNLPYPHSGINRISLTCVAMDSDVIFSALADCYLGSMTTCSLTSKWRSCGWVIPSRTKWNILIQHYFLSCSTYHAYTYRDIMPYIERENCCDFIWALFEHKIII